MLTTKFTNTAMEPPGRTPAPGGSAVGGRGGWWRWPATGQAVYYVTTGLWPSFSPSTFQAVTGPKVEMWLVQLFGVLLCIPGGILIDALRRGVLERSAAACAIAAAAVLLIGDVVYVAKGDIGPVYLLDAVAEVILLVAWAWALLADRRARAGAARVG